MKSWIILVLLCGVCSCSNILVFYPGNSGSLLRSFNQLFQELSSRGHQVTVVTTYELPEVKKHNITQILLGHALEIKNIMSLPLLHQIYYLWQLHLTNCRNIMNDKKMAQFLNSNQTYDLFIGSPFYFLECSIAIAHHLKLPVLNIFSNRMQVHVNHQIGELFPYSHIADLNLPFSSHDMNFWQRAVNTVFCLGYSLGLSFYYIPQMDALVKQHFPHLPPLQNMLTHIPLTLLNTNIAVHPAQPLPPGAIPVAGLTIPDNPKLPKELQEWMDASDQGVILFSLGSNIKMVALDPTILKVVLSVFSELPQRVLMKWEADKLDGKPENVKISKWIPQTAVLAHSNCQLFMTHGGLHSWMEAVYFSVPLLGLQDTFFDQTQNLAEMQALGHGIHFTGPWTEDSFLRAISDLITEPRYKINIQRDSRVFRDQPMTPLQTAVYWTEYMIRHKGAPHLKSAASTMPWYQVAMLDIVTFMFLCVLVSMFLSYALFIWLKRCFTNFRKNNFKHVILQNCISLKKDK